MPSVLLARGTTNDPVGEIALSNAFAAALPDYDIVPWHPSVLRRAAASRLVRRVDGVVAAGETIFGGGGFAPAPPAPRAGGERAGLLRAMAALSPVASAFGKPVSLLGVGASHLGGPVDRWLSGYLVRRSALLLLGDDRSARILADAGAPSPFRIGADPAWVGVDGLNPDHGPRDVVVVVLDGRAGNAREAAILAALERIQAEGLRIRMQPWAASSGDIAMAQRMAAALAKGGRPVEVTAPPRHPEEAAERLSDAATVVTCRYRAMQAAAHAAVPMVAVAGEPRMAALACRLGQSWVDPDRIGAELDAAVIAAASGPLPSPAAVKEEATRAEAGFALLRLVLEGGATGATGLETLPLGPEPWLP